MSVGKYLTNLGVIAALFGALSTARQTQQMPRDWRRYVIWLAWAAGLVLALGSVAKQEQDEAHEADVKATHKAAKQLAKDTRKKNKRK